MWRCKILTLSFYNFLIVSQEITLSCNQTSQDVLQAPTGLFLSRLDILQRAFFHSWEKLKGRNFTAQFFEFAKPFGKIFGAHPEQKKLRASLLDTNSVLLWHQLSIFLTPTQYFFDTILVFLWHQLSHSSTPSQYYFDTNSVRRASLSNMCQPISIFQDKVVMMSPNLIDSKLRQFVLTFGLTSWHSLGVYWDTQFVNNNLFLQTFEMW